MRQEDKELLLKDLCGRLPYGVKCCVNNKNELSGYLVGIIGERIHLFSSGHASFDINDIKSYLFPISSMTEEQKEDMIRSSCGIGSDKNVFDWYNKNHFDYRGLIPMGLAIDATGLNIY